MNLYPLLLYIFLRYHLKSGYGMVVCDLWEHTAHRKSPNPTQQHPSAFMELSLDLSLGFVPKPISLFFADVSGNRDKTDKVATLDGFVQRLEDELRKVEAFKRELPLCMLLLNDGVCLYLLLLLLLSCRRCAFLSFFLFHHVLWACSYRQIERGKSKVFSIARSAYQ